MLNLVHRPTHAAWYGLGPRPIELAKIYIGKYYAVTFYNIKYPRQDRDPGAALSVFSSMSTQLG